MMKLVFEGEFINIFRISRRFHPYLQSNHMESLHSRLYTGLFDKTGQSCTFLDAEYIRPIHFVSLPIEYYSLIQS